MTDPVQQTAAMKGRWSGLAPRLGYWREWLLAYFRLDPVSVCGMSWGRGEYDDFHDYPDSEAGAPLHDYLHTCKRCGKGFRI